MGREVRMVPADWQHPKYPADHPEPHLRDSHIPLYGRSFASEDAEWNEGHAKWQKGFVKNYGSGGKWRARTPDDGPTYSQWSGERPSPDHYMPDWPREARTHLMMYEDTSEGTPISPAFATPEELARWLADNGASSFGNSTATYEQWLRVCKGGWAPSMVMDSNGLRSGVEALAEIENHEATTNV
jgi:hypothetical protein